MIAVAIGFVWGMGLVVAKAAIDHFPPILLMALRFTLVASLLVWFVKPPWASLPRILGASVCAIVIQYSMIYTGLKGLEASTVALLFQLAVPFAALLSFLVLNERLGLRRALGIVVAIVGIICLTGEPKIQDAWPYALLVVEGAFMFAFGQVLLKGLSHVGGYKLVTWIAVCSAPQLFLASWIFEHDQLDAIRNASNAVWFAVFYMAVIMTAVGYGLWYRLLRRYELNQVVPFLLIEPLAAVLGGVLFLGEQLTVIIVVGGIVIISGVAVIVIERNPFGSKKASRGLPAGEEEPPTNA